MHNIFVNVKYEYEKKNKDQRAKYLLHQSHTNEFISRCFIKNLGCKMESRMAWIYCTFELVDYMHKIKPKGQLFSQ